MWPAACDVDVHAAAGGKHGEAPLFAARLAKNIDVRRRPAANSNPTVRVQQQQQLLFAYHK